MPEDRPEQETFEEGTSYRFGERTVRRSPRESPADEPPSTAGAVASARAASTQGNRGDHSTESPTIETDTDNAGRSGSGLRMTVMQSPRPGDLLFGKYRIERLLGRGGMGEVWLVQHEILHDQLALKLILVTAQRPGEVALSPWNEFDLNRRIGTIPPERAKNGTEHPVPLSDLAIALIRHLRRRFGESPYLIPSRCWRAKDDGPTTVRALSQGIRDRRKRFGIPNFTPHDLRRTAASLMTASAIPRLHVEKVLSHTIDDVAEIYDRHDYSDEKRFAITRLGERIQKILVRRGVS